MYYIEATDASNRTRLWTGREWVRNAMACFEDIAIKGYKRQGTAINAAGKLQKEYVQYTLKVVEKI